MPVSSVASPPHPPVVASGGLPVAMVPRPQGVGNLPRTSLAVARDRAVGKPGVERGPIELPLTGVPREALQRLGEKLSSGALSEWELATLITTGKFGRTSLGHAMAPQLVADALRVALPQASDEERNVWEAVVEDAIRMPVQSWHERHANPPSALVRPKTAQALIELYKLLQKSTHGPTSWSDVFPPRQGVSERIVELEQLSRIATLDTSVPGRNGQGGPWSAALVGALILIGGIPAAQADVAPGEADEADAQVPLLRQQLANVAAPVVRCLAPLGSLLTRYPRAAATTVAGAIGAGITTALYARFGNPGDDGANSQALPFASLAGVVTPDILANVMDVVRHGYASLDADGRALQAVRTLGPAADGVRARWELGHYGRTDRVDFMPPDLDVEFGGWLIKQALGDPVPPGGVDMTWSTWTLPNGLRVILVPGKGDMASVQLRFGDGSGIEREGQRGAVHLAEHLSFRRDLPGGQRFDDLFAAAGVKNNAYTTSDTTVYFAEGPVDALQLALYEKSYRLAHATDPLPPGHFETERDVVLNELKQRDNTARRANGVLARAMYPLGHPYHTSVGGRPAELRSLQAGDMENFMRARQRPNLATLVISGNVDEDHVRGLVTDYFADIEPGNTFPQRAPDVQQRTVDTNEEIFDSVTTPRLYRAWNVPQDGHTDLPALMLGADVLTRRLNDALENDIVFGAADVEPRELGSQFRIVLYLRGDADQGLVEETLGSVSSSFLAEGPTEGELDRARRALISGSAWKQESSDAIASAVVHCVDRGGAPDCHNVDVQGWNDATAAWVRDVAGPGVAYLAGHPGQSLS